jgi:ABC-type glycerol-3-phosphate transport system substrate-binding protein
MDFGPFKHVYEYVAMTGGSMFSSDFKQANLTDSKIRPAFEYFVNLQSGPDAPAKYASGANQSVGGDMFAQGNVSVLWMGRWAYYAYNLDKANFEIGVAPPPVMNKGDKPFALSTGMVANSISASTDYPDQAYKFLEYFMTEGMTTVSDLGFNIPGNKTVATTRFVNVSDEKVKKLNQYFVNAAQEYTQPVQFNPYISETRFETIMGKEFTLVYENKQTIDKALQNAQDQVNDVIKLSLNK